MWKYDTFYCNINYLYILDVVYHLLLSLLLQCTHFLFYCQQPIATHTVRFALWSVFCRYFVTPRIYSGIFAPTTSELAVIRVRSAGKRSEPRRAWSSTSTSTAPWSPSPARCAPRRIRNSRICAVTSGCTPPVGCRSSATSATRASARWPPWPSTKSSVIQRVRVRIETSTWIATISIRTSTHFRISPTWPPLPHPPVQRHQENLRSPRPQQQLPPLPPCRRHRILS